MMLLKYCRRTHLDAALTHGQLRLGTFFEYQGVENELLRDSHEGASAFVLQADPDASWVLTNEESNAVVQSPDEFQFINDWKLSIPAGHSVRFEPRAYNTFLFSLSDSETPSSEVMGRLGYDSAYEVLDIDAFATAIAQKLLEHLRVHASVPLDPIAQVIEARYGRVTYRDDSDVIVTPATRYLLTDRDPRTIDADDLWTKPTSFTHESEFRIAWFVLTPATGDYASVRGEPQVVSVPEVRDLIRAVSVDELDSE